MLRTIKAQITIYNSKADKYGNRYWAFTYHDLASEKSVNAKNSGDNAGHIYREMGFEVSEVTQQNQELKIREFDRMVKNWPYAGCTPKDLAAWIRKELEATE